MSEGAFVAFLATVHSITPGDATFARCVQHCSNLGSPIQRASEPAVEPVPASPAVIEAMEPSMVPAPCANVAACVTESPTQATPSLPSPQGQGLVQPQAASPLESRHLEQFQSPTFSEAVASGR